MAQSDRPFADRWAEATEERATRGARLWLQCLTASGRRVWDHGGTNLAAALAFYAMLSLIPAALVFVAFVGLFGQYPQTVDAIVRLIGDFVPAGVVDSIRGPIESLVLGKGGAQALIGIGLVFALWSGSGYVGVFMWVAARVWGVREHRSYWFRLVLRLIVAMAMIVALAVTALFIVLSGPVVQHLAERPGWHGVLRVWSWSRWPLFVFSTTFLVGLLYCVGPDVRYRGLRWLVPGAVLGIAIWLLASYGFTRYLAVFNSYNKLYGSLATIVIFLMWLWLLNLALLFGAEFNAELAERRGGFAPRGARRPVRQRLRRWLRRQRADAAAAKGADDPAATRR
jgi:membrane protein